VRTWDASSGTEQAVTGATIAASHDRILTEAVRNAERVDRILRTTFGRDGLDGRGSTIDIVVHAPNQDGRPNMNNAYWDPEAGRIYLGDGDGKLSGPLGSALDVMMHEATHAIVDSEVHLSYDGQQGGINESFADVLGAVADPGDWKIGEDAFTPRIKGDAIRDMAHPTYAHVSELPTGIALEPHDYAGPPSLAAVQVGEALGRKAMGKIWYSALVDHLHSNAGYAAAARATLDAASDAFGITSREVRVVYDAWRSVGVDPRWKDAGRLAEG
jgi:Zn-dependent metalloprotease